MIRYALDFSVENGRLAYVSMRPSAYGIWMLHNDEDIVRLIKAAKEAVMQWQEPTGPNMTSEMHNLRQALRDMLGHTKWQDWTGES